MGLLARIYEKRSEDEWAGHNKEFLAGDDPPGEYSTAGQKITQENSLQITTVFKCVDKISKTLSTLPLNIYKYLPNGGKEKTPDHHLQYILHVRANPQMTATEFRKTLKGHYLLWGNAYAQIIRNGLGQIIELWPFRPDRMTPKRDNGIITYEYTMNDGQTITFQQKDVWHLRDLSLDGFIGLSRISQARECLGLAKATEKFGSKFFSNAAKATGILEHPGKLTEGARDNIKKSVSEQIAGAKMLGMLILEEGMSWKQIGIPPDDAQFLETRNFQAVDICGLFDVPPNKIGLLDRATYSNIEHLDIEWAKDTILPHAVYWEQKIDSELLPEKDRGKYFSKHNMDGILRGDTLSRGEFYNKMFMIGAYSQNDIRELEDKNPFDGGDEHYVPLNMIKVGDERPQMPTFTKKDEKEEKSFRIITPIQIRSIQGRKRLAEVNKRLFSDAVSRIVGMENIAITRAVKKYIKYGVTNDFVEWLNDYYVKMPESIEKNMLSIFMAYADVVQIEANQEIGNEPQMTPELEKFVADYENVYSFNYINSSKNQINKIIRETPKEDDVSELILARVGEWREKRPEKEAGRQVIESSSAFSKAVYLTAGVMSMKWIAAGIHPCPYCIEMNGRIVGIQGDFINKGEQLNPEGGSGPMLTYQNKSHPPLHDGCECTIIAII